MNTARTIRWALLATSVLAVVFSTRRAAAIDAPRLSVSADFDNGSAEVESIDQRARVVRIKPVEHAGRGWTCWWYFKLSGVVPGETIAVEVAGGSFAQPDRATFSVDRHTWKQTALGEKRDGLIVYRQRIDGPEAWFAWGPPFTNEDAAALVRRTAANRPYAQAFELCRSRGGRPVPALQISQKSNENTARRGVCVIARQHAWECGGSWVCQGLMEWLASDDPRAESLRKRSLVQLVPVMDVDNVAIGAGGKEESPRDHNRDWTDQPYHPAVAALQRAIKKQDSAGRFDLFIDLHNPAPADTTPFFFISPREILSESRNRSLERLLAAAEAEITGPFAYYGQTRESGEAYDARWRQIAKNWVTAHTADRAVSVTLEVPWNTAESTTEGYTALGRELGLAMGRYFRETVRAGVSE